MLLQLAAKRTELLVHVMPDAMRSSQIMLSMHNEELYKEQRKKSVIPLLTKLEDKYLTVFNVCQGNCCCLQNAKGVGDPAIEPGRVPTRRQSLHARCMCHLDGSAPARGSQAHCRQSTAGTGTPSKHSCIPAMFNLGATPHPLHILSLRRSLVLKFDHLTATHIESLTMGPATC